MSDIRRQKVSKSASSTSNVGASYQLGAHTLRVPLSLHSENRARLCARLKARADYEKGSVVLLHGGESRTRYCTDTEQLFRQESYFHWAFGVLEPEALGAIEVDSGRSMLFIPRLPAEYAVWMGTIETPVQATARYAVDETHFVDEVASVLSKINASQILRLHGPNTDSSLSCQPAKFSDMEKFKINDSMLHPEISECRVFKSDAEIAVLRYVNRVSSEAHVHLMRTVKDGLCEFQAESMFLDYIYRNGGCRHISYTCVGASGQNSAVLHYGHAGAPNDRQMRDGDTVLFDMGGEYYCYASDITVCYPVSGRFRDAQRFVYETVVAANRAVLRAAKPGVAWADMHLLAERTILEALKKRGCLVGDVDKMLEERIGAVFMPHGLGHFMGLDVHDVGGYNNPEGFHLPPPPLDDPHPRAGLNGPARFLARIAKPGLRKLRTVRTLQPRMVITVEPGLYFNDACLEPAYNNPAQRKFFVREEIERLRAECGWAGASAGKGGPGMGGVRIEDDVLITKDGCELLTRVPRGVLEIEKVMSDGRTDATRKLTPEEERRACAAICERGSADAQAFYYKGT